MGVAYRKGIVYGLLGLLGLGAITFALYEQQYVRLVAAGNRAVAEQRFDSRDYERAQRFWFAQREMLRFNQGVMAYKARNLSRAAEYFRQASQRSRRPELRMQALYNLGLVMLALDEVEGAAELFKQALRLNPTDADTKFNLERLYHFVLRQEGEHGDASLEQAPGAQRDEAEGRRHTGQGRSSAQSGI